MEAVCRLEAQGSRVCSSPDPKSQELDPGSQQCTSWCDCKGPGACTLDDREREVEAQLRHRADLPTSTSLFCSDFPGENRLPCLQISMPVSSGNNLTQKAYVFLYAPPSICISQDILGLVPVAF